MIDILGNVEKYRHLTTHKVEYGWAWPIVRADANGIVIDAGVQHNLIEGDEFSLPSAGCVSCVHVHTHPAHLYKKSKYHPPTGVDYATCLGDVLINGNPFSVVLEKNHIWILYPNKHLNTADVRRKLGMYDRLPNERDDLRFISNNKISLFETYQSHIKTNGELAGIDLINGGHLSTYFDEMAVCLDGDKVGFSVHCYAYENFSSEKLNRHFSGRLVEPKRIS